MDIPLRPIVSGLLGAVLAHFLIRWLGRRFPIERKPHSLSWYEQRYAWVEKACLAAFLAGIGVALLLYRTTLSRNDPRGAAVGFALGCFLAFAVLVLIIKLSHIHTFRDYWDYQELKYGARNVFALYLVLPLLAVSIYGALHLLIKGV
jgi:hypothetical protein